MMLRTHTCAVALVVGIGGAVLVGLGAPLDGVAARQAAPAGQPAVVEQPAAIGQPAVAEQPAATGQPAAAAPAATAAGATPIEGLWKRHDAVFTYLGFTSFYSCGALADKLALLLKAAGARPDVWAVGTGCYGSLGRGGGPSPIASARLTFYALEPVDAGSPAAVAPVNPTTPTREIGRPAPKLKKAAPKPGVGAWKSVKLEAHSPRALDEGDCELVAQFVRELLPTLTTRNVDSHMSCEPSQHSLASPDLFKSLGGISVTFETLAALPLPEVAKPAATTR